LVIPSVKVAPAHRPDPELHARENGGRSGRVNLIERSEIPAEAQRSPSRDN
jgi:hypothetical protein